MELSEKANKIPKDLIGFKVGNLTILEKTNRRVRGRVVYKCLCVCVNICYRHSESFYKAINSNIKGTSISCGCSKGNSNGRLKLPTGVSSMHVIYDIYRRAAIRRGYSFNLTIEDFSILTKKNCYYCNIEPHLERIGSPSCNGAYTYNGIDRLDNTKGYSIENCVTCCKRCNQAKNNMTLDEFKLWINNIYTNMQRRSYNDES